ncbi:MAG: proton-conducting transporter membrane subunit, partial [Planctomycetota bacterium]
MVFLTVVILFAVSAVAPFVRERMGKAFPLLVAGAPAACAGYFASKFYEVIQTGKPILSTWEWSQALGMDLAANLDGLSLLFAMLVCGIGAFVMLYATSYMKGEEKEGRFFAFLGSFMASMLGLVLVDNLLLVFVFWELTSITSYLLIGWVHKSADSRKSALQALVTTGLGGLALLAGLVLLGIAAGTWSISEIANSPDLVERVRESELLPGILVCVLAGCFTKSAQFPFHYWLPNAMAAPTPVSAYLHSSTMVKAGVFLIARLNPIFDGVAGWSTTLVIFGGFTMLFAAYMGSRQSILKRLLAYSTVSSLGLMVFLIGLGSSNHYALYGAMGYLLAHALFKATLFLVAGTLTHETGEKDIERLGGLHSVMPMTSWAGFLAALSMAGVPMFLGFQGKEFLLKATLEAPKEWVWWLFGVAVIAAIWNVMIGFCVGWKPFRGALTETKKHPHDAPRPMWIGPIVLAVLALVGGLAPGWFAKPVVEQAVAAVQIRGDHAEPKHDAEHAETVAFALIPVAADYPEEHTEGAHHGDGAHAAGHYEVPWTLVELWPTKAKSWIALMGSLSAIILGIVAY